MSETKFDLNVAGYYAAAARKAASEIEARSLSAFCQGAICALRTFANEIEAMDPPPDGQRAAVAPVLVAVATFPGPPAASDVTARALGYTGDCCSECGSFTMVRNGACLKCETCGATSGCS